MPESIVSSSVPTWSSTNHPAGIVSFPVNEKPISCPIGTRVEFFEGGTPQEATLSDINFLDFREGVMKVCMNSSGAVERILLGERTPSQKKKKDIPVEYPVAQRDRKVATRQDTKDDLRSSVDTILAYMNAPNITNTPPAYSLGHVYRKDIPSKEMTGYPLGDQSLSYTNIKQDSQKKILLETLKAKEKDGSSCHPDLVKFICGIIDSFPDIDGDFLREKLFTETLISPIAEARLLTFDFLTHFYYGSLPSSIPESVIVSRKALLLSYKIKNDRIPYQEVTDAIEKGDDSQKLIAQLVQIFRDIPQKDRVAFLSLLSAEPVIQKLQDTLKQGLDFSHSIFNTTKSRQAGDALLKNIRWLELSNGCSVGCAFCSLEPSRKNSKDLSHFSISDILLLAASYGKDFQPTLYHGSDPLDWEGKIGEVALHYFDLHSLIVTITGRAPYISTAVPKGKVSLAEEYAPMINRISLSYWNENRLGNHQFTGLGEGLLYASRGMLPSDRKSIQWSGISKERANKKYEPLDVNAWFPSCSSGVKVSPDATSLSNHITLGARDATIAPQGYFEVAINQAKPTYLSRSITYGKSKGDLSILQDLMTGSIALPVHVDDVRELKTPQIFGRGSFFLNLLGFDGQERKYVFVYNRENTEKSAIVYLTPEMYSELYFTDASSVNQSHIDTHLNKKLPEPQHDYTAHEIIDIVTAGENLTNAIGYLRSPKNLEACHFTIHETKNLIETLLKTHNGREDDHGYVIEKLIKHIMFHEESFDIHEMITYFRLFLSNSVLSRVIQLQMRAAIQNFEARIPRIP